MKSNLQETEPTFGIFDYPLSLLSNMGLKGGFVSDMTLKIRKFTKRHSIQRPIDALSLVLNSSNRAKPTTLKRVKISPDSVFGRFEKYFLSIQQMV